MRITNIDIYKLNIPYKYPLKTPLGIVEGAKNIVVKVRTTNSDIVGWGEASPYAPITGDSQDTAYVTAQSLAGLIKGKNPLAIESRMAEIRAFTIGDPSIRSAFDMALYDIASKSAAMPLYQYLGGGQREIRTDLTIGMQETVDKTVFRAREVVNQGFDSIKLKVGRPGTEDFAHVSAVRELVGENINIRIDSNQGWDYPTAVNNLILMKDLHIEYSEQPLAAWDYRNLSRLRNKVALPICVDESVFDSRNAFKVLMMGSADYINIKLGKAGGIHEALKITAIAEAAGCKCMIGCFAESRLGLTAAAHLAMARPNIHFLDLDSAYGLKEDPVIGGMSYGNDPGGVLSLPELPGLAVDMNADYLEADDHITI